MNKIIYVFTKITVSEEVEGIPIEKTVLLIDGVPAYTETWNELFSNAKNENRLKLVEECSEYPQCQGVTVQVWQEYNNPIV